MKSKRVILLGLQLIYVMLQTSKISGTKTRMSLRKKTRLFLNHRIYLARVIRVFHDRMLKEETISHQVVMVEECNMVETVKEIRLVWSTRDAVIHLLLRIDLLIKEPIDLCLVNVLSQVSITIKELLVPQEWDPLTSHM